MLMTLTILIVWLPHTTGRLASAPVLWLVPPAKKSPPVGGLAGTEIYLQPWNFIISGTISSATMLMILISGLMAGPAVSL